MTCVAVRPTMLRWACGRAAYVMRDLASRFPQVPIWERGEKQPTFKQLEAWSDIDFRDDRDGALLVATVRRKKLELGDLAVDEGAPKTTQKTTHKTTQKTTQKILAPISGDPGVTRQHLAEVLGITSDGVKYHLRKLQEQGLLRRIGSDKGGRWKVEAE